MNGGKLAVEDYLLLYISTINITSVITQIKLKQNIASNRVVNTNLEYKWKCSFAFVSGSVRSSKQILTVRSSVAPTALYTHEYQLIIYFLSPVIVTYTNNH